MNNRIDLTENRDFRHSARYEYIPKYKPYKLHPMIFSAIPNIEYANDFDIECPDDHWGIFQGNAKVREFKKRARSFCDYITCDCCGKKLYPYYQDSLCVRCRDVYNYEIPKWR
jgi:hypothetical protein